MKKIASLFGLVAWAWAAPAQVRPYAVQMHLHGSMSEGPGSMRGGNHQARELGLDVLWWSDHDWRVSYHTFADGYDFEGPELTHSVPVPYPAGTDSGLVSGQQMQITLAPHKSNGKVRGTVVRTSTEREPVTPCANAAGHVIASPHIAKMIVRFDIDLPPI